MYKNLCGYHWWHQVVDLRHFAIDEKVKERNALQATTDRLNRNDRAAKVVSIKFSIVTWSSPDRHDRRDRIISMIAAILIVTKKKIGVSIWLSGSSQPFSAIVTIIWKPGFNGFNILVCSDTRSILCSFILKTFHTTVIPILRPMFIPILRSMFQQVRLRKWSCYL